MAFDFLRKQDASFWESPPQPERFVLKPRTSGFADYKINNINIQMIKFSLLGETILEWNEIKSLMKREKWLVKTS